MRTLTIQIEDLEAGLQRFRQAWETGKPQGEFVTFESIEGLQRALTPRRWELIRVLQAEGPMTSQFLAQRLGRRHESVRGDVARLKELDIVEDTETGGLWVPYDEIRAELVMRRHAA
jgi:predicted transcriptional regulator